MKKITRAALIRMLPIGTKLTLVKGPFGECKKIRTVEKISQKEIKMNSHDKHNFSYLSLNSGDEYFLDENGFTVNHPENGELIYKFGHVD